MVSERTAPKPIHCVAREEAVSALAVIRTEDGDFLVAGDRAAALDVYSLETFRVISKTTLDSQILTVKPRGNLLISHTRSSDVRLWKLINRQLHLIKSYRYPYERLCSLELTQNFTVLPTTVKGEVKLLTSELNDVDSIFLDQNSGDIMALKAVRDDICIVGFELKVIILDCNSRLTLNSVHLVHSVMCLDLSDKFKRIFCGTAENITVVNDSSTIVVDRQLILPKTGVSCISIRQDEKILACGCWDGRIRIYSCNSLKLLASLDLHEKSITNLTFTDSSVSVWKRMLLIASCESGLISVWDIYN